MTGPVERVALMVTSDPLPDGTYGTTLSLGDDVAWTLTRERSSRYAASVAATACAAEHDAATVAALLCRGIPLDLAGEVVSGCRALRPSLDRWTAPLILTAGVSARSHHPFIRVVHRDRDDVEWQWTPEQARQHADHVLQCSAAAVLDTTLTEVLTALGLDETIRAAVVDHVGAHWPGREDEHRG